MKKGSVIIYILGIIGLDIALLCCSYIALLIVPYSSEYLADLLFIVFYGLLFYAGNTGLCSSCLKKSSQIKPAYIFVFILEALSLAYFNQAGALFVVVSISVAFTPIRNRQKQLKLQEQQQMPCICRTCGKPNDGDAVFCTNCGSGLSHTPIQAPQYVFCPYCGKRIILAPFCSYCGSQIKTPGN